MAEETSEAAPSSPRKGKRLIVIAALAVVVVSGALAALYFAGKLSPSEAQGSAGDMNVEIPALPEQAEAVYIALDPAFTVNLQGGTRTRFLQTNVEIVTYEPKMAELVIKHMPVIRNALVMLLSSKEAQELDSREGKESLRSEALATIQEVLQKETGSEGIEGVFFTSFVMQ
jgi:flagellar FliL protein